jgi:hypothetical protein
MNRADRRAARGQHLDCGCTLRLLRPVEERVTCPGCGQCELVPDVPMPTGSPLASIKNVNVPCSCGLTSEVRFYVDVL